MLSRKKQNNGINEKIKSSINKLEERNSKDRICSLVSERIFDEKYKYEIYKRAEGIYQIFIFRLVYDDYVGYYWEEEINGAEIHLCDSFEKSQILAEELVKNMKVD